MIWRDMAFQVVSRHGLQIRASRGFFGIKFTRAAARVLTHGMNLNQFVN